MPQREERAPLQDSTFHMADVRRKRATARRAVAVGELHAGSAFDDIVAKHPAARDQVGITYPADHPSHEVAAYWMEKDGTWKTQTLGEAAPRDSEDHEHGLADFIYELHYDLGIPVVGIYLMGIVSIIYRGCACVSCTASRWLH